MCCTHTARHIKCVHSLTLSLCLSRAQLRRKVLEMKEVRISENEWRGVRDKSILFPIGPLRSRWDVMLMLLVMCARAPPHRTPPHPTPPLVMCAPPHRTGRAALMWPRHRPEHNPRALSVQSLLQIRSRRRSCALCV